LAGRAELQSERVAHPLVWFYDRRQEFSSVPFISVAEDQVRVEAIL
jgi:hypothetical protein